MLGNTNRPVATSPKPSISSGVVSRGGRRHCSSSGRAGRRVAACEPVQARGYSRGYKGALGPAPCVACTGLTCGFGGALGGTRTPNLLIRSQMLYPLSYERGSVRGPV